MGNVKRTIYQETRILISETRLEEAYELLIIKHPKDENLLLLKFQSKLCKNEYLLNRISFDKYKRCINLNVTALILYTNEMERSNSEMDSRMFLLTIRK